MSNTEKMLEIKDLSVIYETDLETVYAVNGVTLSLEKGATLGLVGETGAGKTTLALTLMRLLPERTGKVTSGSITFEGEDITKLNARQMKRMRQELQIIFQDPYASLDPRKSVIEIIAEYMIINKTLPTKREIYNRAAHLMDVVGLARRYATAYPHELDGGRRQRIGIARALSVNPKFIVCDEPVSALDVSIQAQILNLLMDLQDEMGLTYMFVTHDLSVVKHISNNIVVMYLGQCLEFATSDELFASPVHPYTKALLSAIPEPDISMRNKEIKVIKGEVASPVDPKPGCRFAARCEYCQERCTQEAPTLKEVSPGHFVACHLCEN